MEKIKGIRYLNSDTINRDFEVTFANGVCINGNTKPFDKNDKNWSIYNAYEFIRDVLLKSWLDNEVLFPNWNEEDFVKFYNEKVA